MYRKTRAFKEARLCRLYLECLARSRDTYGFLVHGFVLMPDHVHLLLGFEQEEVSMPLVIQAVKRLFSTVARQLLEAESHPAVERFTHTLKDGAQEWRFWAPGGGYDRNMFDPSTVYASLRYLHQNPVKAGLCSLDTDYQWSSARAYQGLDSMFEVDCLDPWG